MPNLIDANELAASRNPRTAEATYRSLLDALQFHQSSPATVFVVATMGSSMRLERDVREACAALGYEVGTLRRVDGEFQVDGRPFRVAPLLRVLSKQWPAYYFVDPDASHRCAVESIEKLQRVIADCEEAVAQRDEWDELSEGDTVIEGAGPDVLPMFASVAAPAGDEGDAPRRGWWSRLLSWLMFWKRD